MAQHLNYLYLYYMAHFFYGVGYYVVGPYVPYLAEEAGTSE